MNYNITDGIQSRAFVRSFVRSIVSTLYHVFVYSLVRSSVVLPARFLVRLPLELNNGSEIDPFCLTRNDPLCRPTRNDWSSWRYITCFILLAEVLATGKVYPTLHQPLNRQIIQSEFSPTWSCVSLTRSTTLSEWKLFRFDKMEVNCFQISLIAVTFYLYHV